jgi:hypothetical protein
MTISGNSVPGSRPAMSWTVGDIESVSVRIRDAAERNQNGVRISFSFALSGFGGNQPGERARLVEHEGRQIRAKSLPDHAPLGALCRAIGEPVSCSADVARRAPCPAHAEQTRRPAILRQHRAAPPPIDPVRRVGAANLCHQSSRLMARRGGDEKVAGLIELVASTSSRRLPFGHDLPRVLSYHREAVAAREIWRVEESAID